MKNSYFYKICLLLVAMLFLVSCVPDDEYGVPIPGSVADPTEGLIPNINIAEAKGLFSGDLTTFVSDLWMEGYVTSSDASGNFYKELYLQDHPTNPTAAVRLVLDKTGLYQTYPIGQRIVVKLQGLYMDEDTGGGLTIGQQVNGALTAISASNINKHLIRSTTVATMEGNPVLFSEITEAHIGMLITVLHTQFNKNQLGLPFVAPDESFSTQRTLESCEENASFMLETSAFASFKQLILPGASGFVSGIISRDFTGSHLVLRLNEATDLVFEGARCDPPEVNCGIAPALGINSLFADYFETQTANMPISGGGWTNFIETGTQTWTAYTAVGSNASLGISARMGSNMSGDAHSVAWLITPAIDMDAQNGEVLTFRTSNSFADNSELEVLLSTDWDGNPATITTATWAILPVAVIVPDAQYFGDWVSSGNIALSCVTGTAYIAFRYTGSGDANEDGTYELDEIQLSAE